MNPRKVCRSRVHALTDLPNIGKAMAGDLLLLGIREPSQLTGRRPFGKYEELCRLTGRRQDPCVLDVFMSVTDFMNGGLARPWREFTKTRKELPAGRGPA
jgi:predicted nucleic acid-binding OB-fold protein